MENEYFYISGYWKDTSEIFENYLVCSFLDSENDFIEYDDSIFYYGLTEDYILEAIEQGINSEYEFVITSYEKGV